MKKNLLALVIVTFISPVIWAQSSGKSVMLKPTNHQKRITTVISGKNRSYYSLSVENYSLISVHGPGTLKVFTRARFKPETGNSVNYGILYSVDGTEQKKFVASDVIRSTNDTYSDPKLGIPGQAKEFIIDLGKGDHSIEFYLQNNSVPVAARYIFTPVKAKKVDWIAFSPLRPSEPVDLITKETTVGYYRFSNTKPLKVEINGPTELRVMTRIENHYQMKGRIQYRIQVRENNAVVKTYQLSSERSDVTYYKDHKELIPGKACEFVIDVPKGSHTYEILLLDEDKNTVLGRLMLPKKDVKLVK